MSDVIYENPATPLPEWARWMAKDTNEVYYIFPRRPEMVAEGGWRCKGGWEYAPIGYVSPLSWRGSLCRIIRLADPAYYAPKNPHTDDHGFLPHDGGPMLEWCRGKPVEVKRRDGDVFIEDADSLCWDHSSPDSRAFEVDIIAYRIVADAEQDGSEGREDGDGYRPTPELRYVERSEPVTESIARRTEVLQQKWVSDFQGQEPEWRDVPIVLDQEQEDQ